MAASTSVGPRWNVPRGGRSPAGRLWSRRDGGGRRLLVTSRPRATDGAFRPVRDWSAEAARPGSLAVAACRGRRLPSPRAEAAPPSPRAEAAGRRHPPRRLAAANAAHRPPYQGRPTRPRMPRSLTHAPKPNQIVRAAWVPTDRHCRLASPRWAASRSSLGAAARAGRAEARSRRARGNGSARSARSPSARAAARSRRGHRGRSPPRHAASSARRKAFGSAVASGRAVHVRHPDPRCDVRLPPGSHRARVSQAGDRPRVPLRGCHRVRREPRRTPRSRDRGAVVFGAGLRAARGPRSAHLRSPHRVRELLRCVPRGCRWRRLRRPDCVPLPGHLGLVVPQPGGGGPPLGLPRCCSVLDWREPCAGDRPR